LHKPDWRCSLPLAILAVLSVTSGYLLKGVLVGASNESSHSLNLLQQFVNNPPSLDLGEWLPVGVKLSILGIGSAGFIYYSLALLRGPLQIFIPGWLSAYKFFFYRWYWDQVYNAFITVPLFRWAYTTIYRTLEKGFVESTFIYNPIRFSHKIGTHITSFQTGNIRKYLTFTLLGFAISWEISKFILFIPWL
jgi:NADH:ubiquinone oxidoreductase subunit 5 (subunit L)/multisubunit Na+/H+ antiporter MnhA subunit